MELFFVSAIAYLIAGMATLVIFDLVTNRIRNRIGQAAMDTRLKVASSAHIPGMAGGGSAGVYLGPRLGKALILGCLWLFWPLVLISAMLPRKKNEGEQSVEDGKM